MTKPIKRYFRLFAGLWVWQICYSDEVNYAGLGRNLFCELWGYWRTCRAAKIEHKYKTGREAGTK